jgi:hypothetical protein
MFFSEFFNSLTDQLTLSFITDLNKQNQLTVNYSFLFYDQH